MRRLLRPFSALTMIFSAATMQAQGTVPPPAAPSAEKPVTIHVDLSKSEGVYKPIYSWFGYDEANFTTMRDGVKLLHELHDLSPVPVYIRCHNLLTSGNGVPDLKRSSTNVYSEDANGRPIYDFTIFDGIFDAYKAAGVRPMVELGFMPKDLAAEPPNRELNHQEHNPRGTNSGALNYPPKNYAKWGELIRTLTAHLVSRYGRETVLQWYFEVWNEPNIGYWHAKPEEYWKLYDYAVAGIRAALPGAKVGGPASTGPGDPQAYKFLDDFLEHVNVGKSAANGRPVPLDFVSFHAKGQPRIIDGHVVMGLGHELIDADKGFEIITKYPKFRHLPIILSEADPEGCAACSSRMNPANNYRNGTLYPAYTAAVYKSLFDLQDRHQVNLLSMLSWSFEFENKDYFEGFRSLATNGIDKPVLNFFRMVALMTGDRVNARSDGQVPLDNILTSGVRSSADVDAMATKGIYEAAVLLWNYNDADQPAAAVPTSIFIRGIPTNVGRILVTHYRIDDAHSNAYSVWKAMGSPQNPTTEQYAELKASDGLQLLKSPEWLGARNGQLRLNVEMPRQSVSLLRLEWQGERAHARE
jgi:xylan 1,4-beta-xylosidase